MYAENLDHKEEMKKVMKCCKPNVAKEVEKAMCSSSVESEGEKVFFQSESGARGDIPVTGSKVNWLALLL